MTEESYSALSVTLKDSVATITLDNPPINLFDATLIGDMNQAGQSLAENPDVKVVVIESSNPDFFIAHADVTLIQQLPAPGEPGSEASNAFHHVVDRFRTMPKATIAKIEGRCRGGGSELALACDMRFAAIGKAVLSQPEVGLGIIPGGGGSTRLPRLVGRARALEIILGCADFDAETAERYGYVNRALPADEIGAFVDNLASQIARFPAEAIAIAKEVVVESESDLEDALTAESEFFLRSAHTDAAKRRMAAAMSFGLQTEEVEKGALQELWKLLGDD